MNTQSHRTSPNHPSAGSPPFRRGARRGFTLIELMISVGVLVFIMLGVATVFASVSETIRASMALSTQLKSRLDLGDLLQRDIEGIHPEGFLVIVGQRGRKFQDQGDRDANGNDPNNNLASLSDAYDPNTGWKSESRGSGKRWYRSDILSFYGTGYFRDRMGASSNDATLYQHPGVAATEAWITWAPAAIDTGVDLVNNATGAAGADGLPDIVGIVNNTYFMAGGDQPNNLANQGVLARRVVLSPGLPTAQYIGGVAMTGPRIPVQGLNSGGKWEANLTAEFFWRNSPGGGAAMSMADRNVTAWSLNDLYDGPVRTIDSDVPEMFDYVINGYIIKEGRPFSFITNTGGNINVTQIKRAMDLAYRPVVRRNIFSAPPSREDLARTTSIVAEGISDFIVEFAGDYLNQTATPSAWYDPKQWFPGQDGIIDFMPMLDHDPNHPDFGKYADQVPEWNWDSPPNTDYRLDNALDRIQRFTIWYGGYRDANGNGTTFARPRSGKIDGSVNTIYNRDDKLAKNYRSDLVHDVAPVATRTQPPFGAHFLTTLGNTGRIQTMGASEGFANRAGSLLVTSPPEFLHPFYFENLAAPGASGNNQLDKGYQTDAGGDKWIINGTNGLRAVAGSGAEGGFIGYTSTSTDADSPSIARLDAPIIGGHYADADGTGARRARIGRQTKLPGSDDFVYGPRLGGLPRADVPNDRLAEPALMTYQAAFIRDYPQLWPKLIRITYRVHDGRRNGDEGKLVSLTFRLPSGR